MAEIIVTKKMEDAHLKYWKDKICPKLCGKSADEIIKTHFEKNNLSIDAYKRDYNIYKEIISLLKDKWETVAIGKTSELRRIYEDISAFEKNINDENLYKDSFKDLILDLLKYSSFSNTQYGKRDLEAFNRGAAIKKWSPYTLVHMSKLRNCPYCNRQYIAPIHTRTGKLRADLDHFWPKSKYPCFSMSLYNLVPVCMSCNRSLKRDRDFSINSATPFTHSFNELLKFDLDLTTNIDAPRIELVDIIDDAKKFVDGMLLEKQYNLHRDVAFELVKKSYMYPKEFFKNIQNGFAIKMNGKEIIKNIDKEKLKEHLFGYIRDDTERKNTPLGKFKTDIAEKLGLLER